MRFFVVSSGCLRLDTTVGAATRHKYAMVSNRNYCDNGSIRVLFMLTQRERSRGVFHLVSRVSPATFIDRDSMVNICNRKFSEFGIDGGVSLSGEWILGCSSGDCIHGCKFRVLVLTGVVF